MIFMIALEICGLAISLIISGILAVEKKKNKIDRDIQRLVLLGALLLLCDSLSMIFRGDISKAGYYIIRISNFFVYITNYMILISYGRCIYDYTQPKKRGIQFQLYNIVGICSVLSVCMTIGSQFGNWIYYFDDLNYYHRTELYPLSQIAPLVAAVCFTYIIITNRNKLLRNQLLANCAYIILPLLATIFQICIYGFPVQNIAIVISSWILFCAREIDVRNQLEYANKAQVTFLNNMSHDIRTPMNAIMGFTNIALKNHPTPEVRDCLEKIEESSEYLLTLLNDVLEISRIEGGKEHYSLSVVDINDITTDIENAAKGLMIDRKLNFVVRKNMPENPYVKADKFHIREILIHLLSNAVKFTEDGGTITFETDYYPGKNAQHIVLCYRVSDTGVGISKEFEKKIFDEFSQEETGARTQFKGTGLGLTIAKKYVHMMDAEIYVDSRVGKGSTFTVEIPLELTQQKSSEPEPTSQVNKKNLEGLRVLLAEDNDLNAEIAMVQLEEFGMEITRTIDGNDAVKTFEKSPSGTFDVILMDIMMPQMNGYEATRAIRNLDSRPDGKSVPIIALTANTFAEDVQKSLEAGMNAHLCKPIVMDDVVKTILRNVS